MKKILLSILCCLFILGVATGCGSENINDTTNNNNNTQNTESSADKNNDSSKVELNSTYKVPMKNVYIDTPNYQEIEEGYTELFIVHESRYVAITSDRKATASNAKNAHDIAFSKFKTNMTNYEGGVNSISIESEKTETINGIEFYKFEGKINYGTSTKHDGYAVGYSFILDGVPCEIIGSVFDEEQSTKLIKEIKTTVEAMAKTARTVE